MKYFSESRVFWLLLACGFLGAAIAATVGLLIGIEVALGVAMLAMSVELAIVYVLLRGALSRSAVSLTRLRSIADSNRLNIASIKSQVKTYGGHAVHSATLATEELERVRNELSEVSAKLDYARVQMVQSADTLGELHASHVSDLNDRLRSNKAILHELIVASDMSVRR